MRTFAAAAFLMSAAGTFFAVLVFAQGPGAGETTPIFRAGTTLVEFTIVATDQRGQPVTDLNQNEVAILQNGKPQPVSFFRFEGAAFGPGAVEPVRESIAPGLFTNRPEYTPGPARNVTAIVIDSLNTLPGDQVAVKAQVMHTSAPSRPTRASPCTHWDRICGSSTISPTISRRCARGSRSTTSSSTFRRSPQTSWCGDS